MSTGANFFNLSPMNTDGKYQKKAVSMMLHIVFKVAKTMAPSVIFIDEVEKVFLSDKKKLKDFPSTEPYNRIKKELAKARATHSLPEFYSSIEFSAPK
jgi:IQ and AAA domain-containing protein